MGFRLGVSSDFFSRRITRDKAQYAVSRDGRFLLNAAV
jgi:hypothetical protein